MMAPLSTLKVRHLVGQLPWVYIAQSERTYSGVFMVQSLLPPAGPHLPGSGSVLGVRSKISPKFLKIVQNLPTKILRLPAKIVLVIGQSLSSFNWRSRCLCCGQLPLAALGLTLPRKLRLSYIRRLNKLLGWRKRLLWWAFLWLGWFNWLWS